jgi:hypothetical protein
VAAIGRRIDHVVRAERSMLSTLRACGVPKWVEKATLGELRPGDDPLWPRSVPESRFRTDARYGYAPPHGATGC